LSFNYTLNELIIEEKSKIKSVGIDKFIEKFSEEFNDRERKLKLKAYKAYDWFSNLRTHFLHDEYQTVLKVLDEA
tara:strand:+ start:637 stop:861 length:225 start_codon:yes stop_codon:yes gene_type:complete